MIPNKRDVASAATTCPVEFLLIPPMHFDKSKFFLVIGLQNYEEKIREREKNSLKENLILEKYTSMNKVVLKSQYRLRSTFPYEKLTFFQIFLGSELFFSVTAMFNKLLIVIKSQIALKYRHLLLAHHSTV